MKLAERLRAMITIEARYNDGTKNQSIMSIKVTLSWSADGSTELLSENTLHSELYMER
jgi:hypothetical protein